LKISIIFGTIASAGMGIQCFKASRSQGHKYVGKRPTEEGGELGPWAK
jgi:hypothetical protein